MGPDNLESACVLDCARLANAIDEKRHLPSGRATAEITSAVSQGAYSVRIERCRSLLPLAALNEYVFCLFECPLRIQKRAFG
jgi:hypothetical protein